MTVVSVEYATYQCKKAMKIGLSLFRRRFNSSKCKTMAKMAVARVKLLRNKREVVIRQMRRDIAILLEKKQDATARVRVEHVIREQNIMAANEFVELFCELLVARLQIIAKQRNCPPDLKEGISSLIFAGPRCSEIPELLGIRDVFEKFYGKDFVSAAVDLRPNAGVNRTLIEKLSVRTPSGEVKLKVLKEIAKEYQVDWDTTESEAELLKPPEERIEGSSAFRSASTLPVKASQHQPVTPETPTNMHSGVEERNVYGFQDSASAAEAAEKSAKEAIAAAEAAAYLAGKEAPSTGFRPSVNNMQKSLKRRNSLNINFSNDGHNTAYNVDDARKINRRHSYIVPSTHSDIKFDDSDGDEEAEMEEEPAYHQRHSYNATPPAVQSDIKFDESDVDEEIEMERPEQSPPKRDAPRPPFMQVNKQESFSRVHPKLPDYDTLAARFEALKYRKS
ncbi:OLC1v1011154C1 [Oldenlandia corymbosa var. corymbosa]|uniref:OLC1v1011154C1 n=1 Tax=Oldenlandia corymbosa var. corymbosa TaxID=529605 RepID=A0AAV1DT20_OLDCO|nr:OLC1v1011154C1 [Oldenlandia corymbosa var. corymbosa]